MDGCHIISAAGKISFGRRLSDPENQPLPLYVFPKSPESVY
jgi:hypothetical protein